MSAVGRRRSPSPFTDRETEAPTGEAAGHAPREWPAPESKSHETAMLCHPPCRKPHLLGWGRLCQGAPWPTHRSPPFSEEALLRWEGRGQIRAVGCCWVGSGQKGGGGQGSRVEAGGELCRGPRLARDSRGFRVSRSGGGVFTGCRAGQELWSEEGSRRAVGMRGPPAE